MLLNDHRVRHRQALPGAFTHLLGGEKRCKNSGSDVFGNAGTGIAHPDFHPLAIAARADADGALPVRAAHHVANRLGRVHNQVQHHLVELTGHAGNGWQFRVQVGGQAGDVLPFVFGDQDGAFDGAINVYRRLLHGTRMRELFHRSNDARDLGHAFEQLFGGFGNLVAQVVQVQVLHGLVQGGYQIGPAEVAKGTGQFRIWLDEAKQVAERFVQKLGVVADVLYGGIDFVGDPCRKLSDRLQLLRHQELDFTLAEGLLRPFTFRDVGAIDSQPPHLRKVLNAPSPTAIVYGYVPTRFVLVRRGQPFHQLFQAGQPRMSPSLPLQVRKQVSGYRIDIADHPAWPFDFYNGMGALFGKGSQPGN